MFNHKIQIVSTYKQSFKVKCTCGNKGELDDTRKFELLVVEPTEENKGTTLVLRCNKCLHKLTIGNK